MNNNFQRVVILGSTLTALALVRHCQSLGIPSVVVDTVGGPALDSKYPEKHLIQSGDPSELLSAVLHIIELRSCVLIADSDDWLRWIVENRDLLESHDIEILHSDSLVLNTCLNKSVFLEFCKAKDLPVPQYFDVSGGDLAGVIYPCLVRPEVTRHRAHDNLPKATELGSEGALARLLEKFASAGAAATVCESLLQRNIEQYSVGIARRKCGTVKALVCRKDRPSARFCSGGTYMSTTDNNDVRNLAEKTVRTLELVGIAEIEILRDVDSNAMYLIEVNPRPWVQYELSWRSGFDFLTFLLRPESYVSDVEKRTGERWVSLMDDLYVAISRSEGMIRSGELGRTQYLWSIMSATVFSKWSLSDPGPCLASIFERWKYTDSR